MFSHFLLLEKKFFLLPNIVGKVKAKAQWQNVIIVMGLKTGFWEVFLLAKVRGAL